MSRQPAIENHEQTTCDEGEHEFGVIVDVHDAPPRKSWIVRLIAAGVECPGGVQLRVTSYVINCTETQVAEIRGDAQPVTANPAAHLLTALDDR